jgi:hypothetical protein
MDHGMLYRNCPSSRCQTPHFPYVPLSLPPSVVSREFGDTGCWAFPPAAAEDMIDFITIPADTAGAPTSFRC